MSRLKAALLSVQFLVIAAMLAVMAGVAFAVPVAINTPPNQPTIDAPTPDDPTNDDTPQFFFSASDIDNDPLTYQCQIDSGGYSACSSGDVFGALGEGSHTFEVFARDTDNSDSTPGAFIWFIDLTEPDTSIDSGPGDPSNDQDPAFTFSGTDNHSDPSALTFECQVDSGGWNPCTSGDQFFGLSEGSHTLEVRATDEATNTDSTPDSDTWYIDLTPPDTTIDSGPADPTNDPDASFTFSGSDDYSDPGDLTFECQLDGGGWVSCSSPQDYPGTAEGPHTLEVRAIDEAGNMDPTPATWSWLIDLTRPVITVNAYVIGGADPYIPGTWATGSVRIQSWVCIDPDNPVASGVASSSVPHHPRTITTDGVYPLSQFLWPDDDFECMDNAGNSAILADTADLLIMVDRHAPTCNVEPLLQYIPKNNPADSGQKYTVKFKVARQDGVINKKGIVVTLESVVGGGNVSGMQIGTFDKQGKFEGRPGAIYYVTYRVTDQAGWTSTCTGKVQVSRY